MTPRPCGCNAPCASSCYRAGRGLRLDYSPNDSPDMPAPVVPADPRPCTCACHGDAYLDDDPTIPDDGPSFLPSEPPPA